MKQLDRALGSFNVHRQAYYSGTFVGNHVHRALKVRIINYSADTFMWATAPIIGSEYQYTVQVCG